VKDEMFDCHVVLCVIQAIILQTDMPTSILWGQRSRILIPMDYRFASGGGQFISVCRPQ